MGCYVEVYGSKGEHSPKEAMSEIGLSGYRGLKQLPAWEALRQLAHQPVDLTDAGVLTPQRIVQMRLQACGFDFLYGTQRVDQQVMLQLYAFAAQAKVQQQFAQMVSGEVMNAIVGVESECRQVLHTVSRQVFDDLPYADFSGAGFPWQEPIVRTQQAEQEARLQLGKLDDFLSGLDSGVISNADNQRFSDLVNIGIGGSDLGPKAIYLALQPFREIERQVHYVSNIDPDALIGVLRRLDLSRTLVNVVSKSGGTMETLTNERMGRRYFQEEGLDPAQHFVCVTGKGSPMDGGKGYLETFHMFDYIGGRYSATSMVGGVSLGFGLGMQRFMEILRGARHMDLHAYSAVGQDNLPLTAALLGVWNRNLLGLESLAVLPYSEALIRFTAHLQQLDMESNGKRINRRGEAVDYATSPVVWGEPGTNGQHAFYQMLHQSESIVPCEFIGFRQSQYEEDMEMEGVSSQQKLLANLLAQVLALAVGQRDSNPNRVFPGNRPSWLLLADRLTPHTMGALLAFYEHKVAFQGFLWNINSFDQEGVQLGKVLSQRLLAHRRRLNNQQADLEQIAKEDALGAAMMRAARL